MKERIDSKILPRTSTNSYLRYAHERREGGWLSISSTPLEVSASVSGASAAVPALVFRSITLFIILFQIRLIAGDLADTGVFVTTLLAGFAAAVFLSVFRFNGKQASALAALVSIAIIPWVGRALIALPRLFVPGAGSTAVILDSLLLNLDRNNFVSLFPYYWSAVSTWLAMPHSPMRRCHTPTPQCGAATPPLPNAALPHPHSLFNSRKFFRAAIIADASLLIFIYSVAHAAKIEIYRWPIVIIILFGIVVFCQALALLFSMPPETKLRAKEKLFAVAALLLITICGGFLFLKPFQEQAVEMGGGLLEPKLFSFDLSQYLRLDSEISTKNDLVLIVKKENDDHILLRRSVLSGYSSKQGFYKIEEIDERAHPNRLPGHQVSFPQPEIEAARISKQEYFLVNIDAAAFIAMKEPVMISPYENWDASSFNSAYAVESLVSDADYWDLLYSTDTIERPSPEQLGLTESEYKIYTEYGNDERIRTLAEELTHDYYSYSEKTAVIYNFLKYGEYRYSLKPGLAPDGDQLGYFLFQSKKGYCSYYAFAFTLLLRSLGIPARVAAGFFIDPQTNVFDYYPVRSDMAHAWVEVAFPDFGWVEYDPTTEKVADGEEYLMSSAMDPALFEKLIKEILENRFSIKTIEGADETAAPSFLNSIARAAAIAKKYRCFLLAAIVTVIFLYIRCGVYLSVSLTGNLRKKSIRLLKHACRRLQLAGLRRGHFITEAQWTQRLNGDYGGIYSLYESAAAARFAPEYSKQDLTVQWANYKLFCESYNKRVPLWRRIAAWVFPPAALFSTEAKGGGKTLVMLIVVLGMIAGSQLKAEDDEEAKLAAQAVAEAVAEANELFKRATESHYAENWDRAIELYREGQAQFPDDPRFTRVLGNLFYTRALYTLAWDEYRKTEKLLPENQSLLIRLARTAGYLNFNSLSVDYYERALEINPDNKEAIGGLGWMYFKVHRLADGEMLLLGALENYGDDPDFSMTLGTIYSDLYKYDESKYWYNKAISLGEDIGDPVFVAIAWYNLSILESHFYQFEHWMDTTNYSLGAQNRASGHIARGELYMRRLEIEKAVKDFETAYESDTSPLAKLNLAEAYQVSGRLEEARLYAEDCLRNSDNSWMMNFGIDPDRYKRDIHEVLAKIYSGLAETERLLPREKPTEKIRSLFKTVSYRLKHAVNIRLYRKYCLSSANAYSGKLFSDGGPHLDSFVQYYNAFNDYPRRAVNYLNMARAFETELIPASTPTYNFQEGTLFGDESLIEKALYGFDPLWEKLYISECYAEFAAQRNKGFFNLRGGRRNNPQKSAEELFALNRGALRQAGIKLPVKLNLIIRGDHKPSKKHLEKALDAAGFKKAPFDSGFTLNITISGTREQGYTASCELVDDASRGEKETLRYSINLPKGNRADYYGLARELGNAVFVIN